MLRAAVLYITTRPTVLSTLRSELDRHGLIPDRPTTTIIPNAEARALPYLVACVKEVLRIHPPIVGLLEKQVGPEADVLIDGRIIPGNTKIGISIWAVQRDRDVYGDDADFFRPERWLDVVEEERRKRMDRSLDLVFGGGRFTCLGREVALTQCMKVVAEVSQISKFDESAWVSRFMLSTLEATIEKYLVVAPSVLFLPWHFFPHIFFLCIIHPPSLSSPHPSLFHFYSNLSLSLYAQVFDWSLIPNEKAF